jgi:hypothetical protein
MARQFDLLESFIHTVLDEAGFESLSEATRGQFVPMFVAEAERRLGLALLPLLNDNQAEQLADLANNEKTTAEDLANFWQQNVPNFQTVVEQTLAAFAEEFKKTLATVQK